MKILYPVYLAALLLASSVLFAQVPKLNSYPSAPAVIFLDFDGHTVNGTSWNTKGTIYCAPANLSNEKITEIFDRVAEDYRPFAVNVTTDSAKYWAAPATKRVRAVLTITSEWYGNGAGGIAFRESFTWGDNTPCFIFTALLGYNVKNIAEAASHEVGHTLGLRHQARYDNNCVKTEDYNSGTGTGAVSWAPIMGVGYYRNQTTWHNGPNPFGCTSDQDDLAIITSKNGFGYRPKDHGTSFTDASRVAISSKKIAEAGNISTNTEEDFFKVTLPADSRLQLDVVPYSAAAGESGSNLDVEMKLYSSRQKLLRTYNPEEALSASLDTTLPQGDYYLSVTGVGNKYTSDYASLGAYTVQGTLGEMTVLPLRRLELKGTGNGQKHQLAWVVEADEAIVKQVLEASQNGSAFTPLTQLSAAERSFENYAPSAGPVQYRLSVTFDGGRQHYSNTIAIRSKAAAKPQLYTNLISSNALMVSSPSAYAYTITDVNGRQVAKGQISTGSATLQTGNLTRGLYIIRFTNGSEQHIEKFTRQ